MPYIDRDSREDIDEQIEGALDAAYSAGPGALNYIITRFVRMFLAHHPSYRDFNDAIGVLECAKLELYRRMVAPYEDRKCAENGDVYPAEGR